MTNSRPLTDYKKTITMMEHLKRYEELSGVLLEILDRLKRPSITDEEINQLNTELSDMVEEITFLTDSIEYYNNQNNY